MSLPQTQARASWGKGLGMVQRVLSIRPSPCLSWGLKRISLCVLSDLLSVLYMDSWESGASKGEYPGGKGTYQPFHMALF